MVCNPIAEFVARCHVTTADGLQSSLVASNIAPDGKTFTESIP